MISSRIEIIYGYIWKQGDEPCFFLYLKSIWQSKK